MLTRIEETCRFLADRIGVSPVIGMINGTGLSDLTRVPGMGCRIPYEDIPGFPRSTVEGHGGTLAAGTFSGTAVMALEGRFHLYEGYMPQEITFPIRVMARLGVRYLLISSAVGGLNPQFRKGDLMVVTDHINLTGGNPLIGPNLDTFGPRFPDMSRVYDPHLVDLAVNTGVRQGRHVRQGVYAGVLGPSLETPAETRFLRTIGADAVGMSTVNEAIAGVHCGLKILAIGVITNMNLPDRMEKTSIEGVIATASEAAPGLSELWKGIIQAVA